MIKTDKYDNILNYIIEQADRYDGRNLQFEQDIKFNMSVLTDKLIYASINSVIVDIDSQLRLEQLMQSLHKLFTQYENGFKVNVCDKLVQYYNKAYDNAGQLIEIGKEVSNKFNENTSELKREFIYSEEAIKIVQKHAFELMKGHDYSKIMQIRAELTNMMLSGKANKANVRKMIKQVLDVNKSKAEEITQTELSRVYNMGMMARYSEFEQISGEKVYKYWHGFLYSDVTCQYCKDRIGGIYDLYDDSEELPAHVRCRCVWLPIVESWGGRSSKKLISRANMLNTAYSTDMIYQRINTRLGIDYAEYMKKDAAIDYLSGDRSEKIIKSLTDARSRYIDKIKTEFGISPDTSNVAMSKEFNNQMKFWKQYTAEAIADGNYEELQKSKEAIKGVMLLQWNGEQLDKWNRLISQLDK